MRSNNKAINGKPINWKFIFHNGLAFCIFSYLILLGGKGDKIANFEIISQGNILLFSVIYLILVLYLIVTKKGLIAPALISGVYLFLGITLLSVILSINFWQSINEFYLWGIYFFIFILMVNAKNFNWSRVDLIKTFLFVGFLFNISHILKVLVWIYDWLIIPNQDLFLLLSYRTDSPNQTAAFANIFLFTALAGLISKQKETINKFEIIVVISSLIVLLFSSSRGGYLSTAIGLAVIFISSISQIKSSFIDIWEKSKILIMCIGIIVVVGGSGLLFYFSQSSRIGIESRFEFWKLAFDTFLEYPLLGSGLYTMGSNLLSMLSIPPQELHTHAHSIFLNILGEQGFLGFAAFLILIFLTGSYLAKSYKMQNDRFTLTALGVLGGFLGHGLVDTIYVEPSISIAIVIVCGLGIGPTEKAVQGRSIDHYLPIFIIGFVLSLGWVLAVQRFPYERGIKGTDNKVYAVEKMTQSIRLKPGWALAYQQRGLIYSEMVFENDISPSEGLNFAIKDFESAIESDPALAVNYANLGVLYASIGNFNKALELLNQSIILAPKADLYKLNLAVIAELAGEYVLAEEYYRDFINMQESIDLGPFWQETATRKRIYDELYLINSEKQIIKNCDSSSIDKLQAENLSSEGHLILTECYLDLGKYDLAEKEIQFAERECQGFDQKNEIIWFKGSLDLARGDSINGILQMEDSLDNLRNRTAYERGNLGSVYYGERLFRHPELKQDIVSQFINAPIPGRWFDRLLGLGDWYAQNGYIVEAERTYREILIYDKENADALRFLTEIGNNP